MKENIINKLKELLKYKTIKDNKEEFDKLFKYIKKITKKNLIIKEYVFNENKCLVISNVDTTNYDIIFCTHIDIVPCSTYDFKEDNQNIYGRGTIDMKGSVAVCLELLNNIKTNKKIALFITSDEEVDGNCVYELLKIYNSKLAIVPDGGSNFTLIKEEKGLLQLELSIKTKSAHASQPFNGENAIVKLYEVYDQLLKKYPLPRNSKEYQTSINLSSLNGGFQTNQVPDTATMKLDIRFVAKDSPQDFIDIIKQTNTNIDIKTILSGPVFKTNLNNKDIKNYLKVCKKILNKDIEIIGCESTSDAVYFSEHNIPTIIMNPDGYYPHCENEYVNKESLVILYNIYKEFIQKED